MDVNEELKFLLKFQKKLGGGGSGGGGGGGREVSSWGGQGECDRRIEVFGKIHKKNWAGESVWGVQVGGGGVRVDVNEELKFL